MYNQPFYIPGYYSGTIPTMARGAMIPNRALTGMSMASRGTGLFGKLGNAFGALKAFNWGGLINNTSKTLGIINQTIPLVRQVGPMVGNMRSMLRLASAFKDETDNKPNNIVNNNQNNSNQTNYHQKTNQNQPINNQKKETSTTNNIIDESPTFFIN